MSQPKIIAYMKPVCGWSNGVRAIFAKYGLDYEDRDIINNQDNYREMVQKTRQPYQPCVQIDDIILADVSGDEVEHYLVSEGIVQSSDAETDVPTDQACEDPWDRLLSVSASRADSVDGVKVGKDFDGRTEGWMSQPSNFPTCQFLILSLRR